MEKTEEQKLIEQLERKAREFRATAIASSNAGSEDRIKVLAERAGAKALRRKIRRLKSKHTKTRWPSKKKNNRVRNILEYINKAKPWASDEENLYDSTFLVHELEEEREDWDD